MYVFQVSLNESLRSITAGADDCAYRWRNRQEQLYALRGKVVTSLQDHVKTDDIGNLIGRAGESMDSVVAACRRLSEACEEYRTERFLG